MAFDLFERSRWLGQPVHLFIFQRQGQLYRYANDSRDHPLGEQTFMAARMTRSDLRDSTESLQNNLTIRFPYLLNPASPDLPATQPLGNLWRPYPPSDRVFVSCLAMHRGDDQAAIEWTGRVLYPEFTDTECTLTCEPTRSNGRRSGLPKRFQRNCWKPHYSLGDGLCNVDKDAFAVPATLTTVNGLTLTATAFGAVPGGKSLVGGFVAWTRTDGTIEHRTILTHSGTNITINYGGAELTPGRAVTAYPGCAHNWAACVSFGNEDNYGGALYLPVKNPMGGMPVW